MDSVKRQRIRQEVLEYMQRQSEPVRVSHMAEDLRQTQRDLQDVRESDVRDVVQSMIVTGKLDYTAGLKIELRKAAANNI